jgi:AcrR family transcriptional regulator
MVKLSLASWIGNAASVLCGSWGSVSERARQAGCSRQTIYAHAARVESAVADHLDGPTYRRDKLLGENQQLRQENAELWEALDQMIDFPERKQQEFMATASGMGLSLTQILTLLAILLPAERCPSRAKIGRWLESWCQRAGQILQVLDSACKELVLVMCIDEIFFRRQPVLVGVEPQSMAWVIGKKAENRNGQTWYEALEPWGRMEYAVADAGSGLRKGLSLIEEARQDDSSAPHLEVGLDVFHIKKEALPVIHRVWQKAESIWEKAEQADRDVARCRQRGENACGAAAGARALGAHRGLRSPAGPQPHGRQGPQHGLRQRQDQAPGPWLRLYHPLLLGGA